MVICAPAFYFVYVTTHYLLARVLSIRLLAPTRPLHAPSARLRGVFRPLRARRNRPRAEGHSVSFDRSKHTSRTLDYPPEYNILFTLALRVHLTCAILYSVFDSSFIDDRQSFFKYIVFRRTRVIYFVCCYFCSDLLAIVSVPHPPF